MIKVSAILAALVLVPSLAAQGLAGAVHGQFGSPNRVQYSLGWIIPRWTLFEATLGATWIHADDGDRYGGQLDLSIGESTRRRLYGVASIAGGPSGGEAENPWGGWSAGLGWRALSIGSTQLSLEGRYLHLWRPDDAVVLGVKIATRWGRADKAVGTVGADAPVDSSARPTVSTVATSPIASTAKAAVSTAIEVMGTPYVWGGSSENGFDCSGLIQYAYQQAGITLPRRSIDQAKAGQLIPREIGQLEPGDILTFSRDPGGPVSHVGLYVGERRFIHSSSTGVRLSLLDEGDPNGKHWLARWIGVRRVVQ
ncbi:MAG TPA: C40 family peptidase [Gemmatimonadales bacterium]|nr:C40 family peptidase [Gemmatimonadales bacterium]